jgi:hypothetical protein
MKTSRIARAWHGALLIGICGTASADSAAVTVDIRVRDPGHIEVEWHFQKGTQPTGSKRMLLERALPAAS